MINRAKAWIRDFLERDPWLSVRFTLAALVLYGANKAILISAVEAGDLRPFVAQFFPVLPMLVPTFLAHRYVWQNQDADFLSYVGNCWSRMYIVLFVSGTGAMTLFTYVLEWQYIAVSTVIGIISGAVTFFYNELKVFAERHQLKAAMVEPR